MSIPTQTELEREGELAYIRGLSQDRNPYKVMDYETAARDWDNGYLAARRRDEEEYYARQQAAYARQQEELGNGQD